MSCAIPGRGRVRIARDLATCTLPPSGRGVEVSGGSMFWVGMIVGLNVGLWLGIALWRVQE